jgi:hypothetical protein
VGDGEAALATAEAAVGALTTVSVEGLNVAGLAEFQRRVRRLADGLELAAARALRAFDRLEGYRELGATDSVAWLSAELGLLPESANDRLRLSRQIDDLAPTVTALEAGSLGYEQAALVARSTERVRPEDRPRVEELILAQANRLNTGTLRQHAAAVVAAVDGEVARRDARRARERRAIRIGPDVDGNATISGYLTSRCAGYLRAALEPFMRPLNAEDARSAIQRRHDGLEELMRAAVTGGRAVDGRGRRPQVVVLAELSTAMGEDGPPPLLQGLVPISQEELDEALCDSAISAVLKDKQGNIAFAGRAARTFSPAKRRAMLTGEATCAVPGCNRMALDSDGHHVDAYADSGLTILARGAALCVPHHGMEHRDGFALVDDGGLGWRWVPPGHPDNPKSHFSSAEYLRLRRRAILGRQRARRKRRQQAREGDPDP